MNTTTDALLDRAKEVLNVHSDYRLAKVLGVTSQHVTNWRRHKSVPEPAIAVRIAEILGQPPIEILAMLEEERERASKTPRSAVVELWKRYVPRILPTVVIAVAVGTPTQDRIQASMRHSSLDPVYIMRTLMRRTKRVRQVGWTPA